MARNFQVVGARVLIKRLENQLASSTIQVVQYGQQEPSMFALVLAVGPGSRARNGVDYIPMDVVPGDTVILKKLCGAPVVFNGEACQMVMREDLLAVVDL